MRKNVLVFDFDGTIADTFNYIVMVSNKLSDEFNFRKIESHEIVHLKDKTSQEMIHHLKVPIMKIPLIVAKAKNELQKDISSIQPVAGLKEILEQVKALGHTIGILTSNSSENVEKFLQNNDLNFFDFISCTSKIWSKNTSINNLMSSMGLEPSEVLYIGDETRDIVAAKKSGITVAEVTWGYNSPKALQSYHPDFLLNKPEDLIGILGLL